MRSTLSAVLWGLGGLVGAGSAACTTSDPCAEKVSGTVCTIAGTGDLAFNRDGLPPTQTSLALPSQVRRGPDGLLYIMDFNNMRLRRVEANNTVSTIAGTGFHAGATEGAAATDSALADPLDFDFLPDGRVVFVSYHDPRVLMIDTDGTLQLVAGNVQTGTLGWEGDGGPATAAKFEEPSGIAIAPDGTIYVADDLANRVRMIRGGTITTVAGTGLANFSGDGGPATAAGLSAPTALALDAAGDLFISDTANCAVRKVTPDGIITTVAGRGLRGFSGDGGPATTATLGDPTGIAVMSDGTLIVGDRLNDRVRQVATDGTITTIAGTGRRGYAGDEGPAMSAELGYLSRVQLDSDGGLLVSDQTNSVIRKILK